MIYFVRHGKTNANAKRIIQGNGPLSTLGVQQAKEAATKLKDIKFDICFCSPLLRTKQTLEEILVYHNDLKVIYDERLIERQYGEAVGMYYDDVENMEKRWDGKTTLPYNIETVSNLYNRVSSFYNDIKSEYKDKTILIVAHSGVGRVSKGYFYGKPTNDNYTNTKYKVANCEIIKFEF